MWCVESQKYGREDFETKTQAEKRYEELKKTEECVFIREKDFEDYMDDVSTYAQKMGFEFD